MFGFNIFRSFCVTIPNLHVFVALEAPPTESLANTLCLFVLYCNWWGLGRCYITVKECILIGQFCSSILLWPVAEMRNYELPLLYLVLLLTGNECKIFPFSFDLENNFGKRSKMFTVLPFSSKLLSEICKALIIFGMVSSQFCLSFSTVTLPISLSSQSICNLKKYNYKKQNNWTYPDHEDGKSKFVKARNKKTLLHSNSTVKKRIKN